MKNSFTKEEIKSSVEYRWRMHDCKFMLIVNALIVIASLFNALDLESSGSNDISMSDKFISSITECLITILYSEVILLPFAVYYVTKAHYLLSSYMKFKAYEVILDHPSKSYFFRGMFRYKVPIKYKSKTINVDTNACFSNSFLAIHSLKEYNNKKVIGLYDNKKNLFYIIRIINSN